MAAQDEVSLSIQTKLNTIIRLLALTATSQSTSLKERATLLDRAGLSPKEIGGSIWLTYQYATA